MIDIIKKFNILLEKSEKLKVYHLLFIATIGAFFEMIGVSLMVPLMSAIMEPDIVTKNTLIARACAFFGIDGHQNFIVLCIISLIIVYIIKALFLVYKNSCTGKFIYENRFCMQQKMFRAFLRKPYEYYLNAHSGEILRTIRTDVQNSYGLLDMLLTLISESIVSLAIIIVVVMINPLMTFLIAGMMFVIMVIVMKVIKPILKEEGDQYRNNVSKAYNWLLQSIQGIKEIMVGSREAYFEKGFENAGKKQVASEKRYSVLSGLPRIAIELGCICSALIALLVMIISGIEPKTLIPAFSAFAMAAVKLMPAFSRVTNCISAISYHGPSVDRLLENLKSFSIEEDYLNIKQIDIQLHDNIEFKQVTYRYNKEAETVLEDANMVIPAGYSVGISGTSGAGKTTMVDILLGLLKPEKGEVLCDGINIMDNYKNWLKHVSYIPQSIFMLDGTIRENIIFGNEIMDDNKVWKALEDAKLADFVRQQPEGLNTEIGERGIRLSGGQRQRIGIARALYSDPELLVLDEATASLDTETETAIMEAIHTLHGKKTMIIIAHRLGTIENCDMVYHVQDKQIILERSVK